MAKVQNVPGEARDTATLSRRVALAQLAGLVAVFGLIGLALCLIGLHFTYQPWPWLSILVCIAIGMLAFGPWKSDWRVLMKTIALVLVLGLITGSVASGIHRFDQQKSARATAARLADAKQRVQARIDKAKATYQQKLATATTEAENQLAADGFVSDDNGDPPSVTLASLTSGTVTAYYFVDGYAFEPVLPIQKIDGSWIAGCPTIVPGVMYPLNGPNNQVAISLNDSGRCPAGIGPPKSP